VPLLEKIRQLPERQKQQLTWAVAGAVGVLLLVLWFATTKIRGDLPKDGSVWRATIDGIRGVKDNYQKK
jgi:hypothetical protein